jgi:hypothetical protein
MMGGCVMKKHLARWQALVVLLALAATLTACGPGSTATVDTAGRSVSVTVPPPAPTISRSVRGGVAPPVVTAGGVYFDLRACIDTTGSITNGDPQLPGLIRGYLDYLVGHWSTGSLSTTGTEASPPAAGLLLRFRYLTVNPLASRQEVDTTIPAVPGVAAEPSATDLSFDGEESAWSTQRSNASTAQSEAVSAEADAVSRIDALPLPQKQSLHFSDIWGCISAVSAQMSASRGTLILESDGLQTGKPQIMLDLHGARVLWVQPCSSAQAVQCEQLQHYWATQLRAHGAFSVTFIQPETASASHFSEFILGAQS